LLRLYPSTGAEEFGPKRLKAVREEIIKTGHHSGGKPLRRKYVNDLVACIKRMFRCLGSVFKWNLTGSFCKRIPRVRLLCSLWMLDSFCLAKRSRALLGSNPTRDSQGAPEVSGQIPQGGRPGDLVDNVVRPWPFGRPSWLEVKLMKRVIHRRNSYLDNTGHWQCSVALVVPLARVSARLRKKPTGTFGKSLPHPREHQSRPEMGSRARGCPERSQAMSGCVRSTALVPDSRASQLARDVQGSSRPLLGTS